MKKTINIEAELHSIVKTKAAERGVYLETFVADALTYWAVTRFAKQAAKRRATKEKP